MAVERRANIWDIGHQRVQLQNRQRRPGGFLGRGTQREARSKPCPCWGLELAQFPKGWKLDIHFGVSQSSPSSKGAPTKKERKLAFLCPGPSNCTRPHHLTSGGLGGFGPPGEHGAPGGAPKPPEPTAAGDGFGIDSGCDLKAERGFLVLSKGKRGGTSIIHPLWFPARECSSAGSLPTKSRYAAVFCEGSCFGGFKRGAKRTAAILNFGGPPNLKNSHPCCWPGANWVAPRVPLFYG